MKREVKSHVIYNLEDISKNKVINVYITVQITAKKPKLSALFHFPYISGYENNITIR